MPTRTANAVWEGNLTEGKGTMKFGGGAFDGQYSFSSRFEEGTGTNPEELIAAAHAGCFSMAFSAQLGEAGLTPESIKTTAIVTLEKLADGFAIPEIELDCVARVPNADEAAVKTAAENAKAGCPISKLFKA